MGIFHCYVCLPEGNICSKGHGTRHQGKVFHYLIYIYINGESRDIFRDSELGAGLGNSMGPQQGPMSLGVPENPTEYRVNTVSSSIYTSIDQS